MLDPTLFVSDTVHEREITTADGAKHRLHFREIPAGDFALMRTPGEDPKKYFAAVSRLIAASLCEPDGKPALTARQADDLKDGVRLAISVAVAEVNGIGAHVGKVSPPETNDGSGTSSSLPVSVGEP